jgi:hypothetical protein
MRRRASDGLDPTPEDLSENPALGILLLLEEGLGLARLALCGVHAELLEDDCLPLSASQAACEAYAFSILSQMQALEDMIRAYRRLGESQRDSATDTPF